MTIVSTIERCNAFAIKFFPDRESMKMVNNLLIPIQGTDEQFYRMGSLAWLGYLSYTQVVESSNLSPSTYLMR